MQESKKYKGKVLLAEPFMEDPNFKRAAVVICDHTRKDGTVGFVLNKPLDMRIHELVMDFPELDAEVFFGGPVQTDTIHYLHSLGEIIEGSTKVVDGLYWGGEFEKLKILIQQGLVEPHHIRFFVGYSGWSAGQIEKEMKIGSWIKTEMFANYLFKFDPHYLWQQILENIGQQYAVIAQMPESDTWN